MRDEMQIMIVLELRLQRYIQSSFLTWDSTLEKIDANLQIVSFIYFLVCKTLI